ncbi:MAG: ATP-binding protein [Nitrosomonadales bacterium]
MNALMSLMHPLQREWGRSIRRQLVWSFSLASLLVSLSFGYLLYSYQRNFQYELGTQSALELAQALSSSSTSWVLANDLVGLQEVLREAAQVTDIKFAVVVSFDGEVQASTRPEYINRYFSDAVSQRMLGNLAQPKILQNNPDLIDVAVPVLTGNRLIGWVRVEMTRDRANINLHQMAAAGFAIAGLLVLVIILIANWLAGRFTRGLQRLSAVADNAEHGRNFGRDDSERQDELGILARHIYKMLDARAEEEQARLDSEARYSVVFNNAAIGLAQVALTGQFIRINQEFCKIIGYTQEEVLTQNFTFERITYPDDIAVDHACIQQLLAGNEQSYTLEKRYVRRDGSLVWVNLSVSLQRDGRGEPQFLISAVLDLSERKKAENELKRYKDHLEEQVQQRTADLVLARDAAEAANRAKSIFLSSMSHELRTPLNAILGFSGLMCRDEMLSKAQRENLDIINRSGEHLLSLINDVLEVAKIEAGRVQVEREPVDLGALLRDVNDMMALRASEKGLQLLVDQSSEFPRYIMGDEARLRQVLINLVGNAVKFTSHGGITIRFGIKPMVLPERLLIEIEDSGIGINPEDQQRIFEPFVQVGEPSTQKGTGLGLTLTRQFIQMMGGEISLESQAGRGSIFRVELPVEKVNASDVTKPEKIVQGEIVGLCAGQPVYRILIVEDQLENQLLLTKLMDQLGFEVKVAENGQLGVEQFLNWHPDLIWMDRRMPVMDGIEATRRIRALPGGGGVKIIAVTASAFMEQRAEMLEAGMDEFVRKPYRFNEIYECLSRHLGVQYRYAEVDEKSAAGEVLTDKMLSTLSGELCGELRAALESLEVDRVEAVIRQVSDVKLQNSLMHLAGNFDYPAILKALPPDTMEKLI